MGDGLQTEGISMSTVIRTAAVTTAAVATAAVALLLAVAAAPVAADRGSPMALAASTTTRIAPGTSLSFIHVRAGRSYAFKRGASYTGTLNISANDVTIGSYGAGRYPVFTRRWFGDDILVSGSRDHISDIRLTGTGYRAVPGCGPAKTAGYEIGIDISGTGDVITSVRAYGNLYAGIYVEAAGSHAVIRQSVFNHVNSLNPSSLGSGAFGILLAGSSNRLDHDIFTNQRTCSPDYGRDGSGVEIYGGSGNLVEHSTGRDDVDFTELGGSRAAANIYLDDTFSAPGEFLVTRGSGDRANGPVHNTVLTGDVAHGAVVSYAWRSGDGTLLTMRNSHVSSLSQDGGYVNAGGNTIGF